MKISPGSQIRSCQGLSGYTEIHLLQKCVGIQLDPVKTHLCDTLPINSYILLGFVMIIVDERSTQGNTGRTQLGSWPDLKSCLRCCNLSSFLWSVGKKGSSHRTLCIHPNLLLILYLMWLHGSLKFSWMIYQTAPLCAAGEHVKTGGLSLPHKINPQSKTITFQAHFFGH